MYVSRDQQILDLLNKSAMPLTVKEIANELVINEAYTRQRVAKLKTKGHITKFHGGYFITEAGKNHLIRDPFYKYIKA